MGPMSVNFNSVCNFVTSQYRNWSLLYRMKCQRQYYDKHIRQDLTQYRLISISSAVSTFKTDLKWAAWHRIKGKRWNFPCS